VHIPDGFVNASTSIGAGAVSAAGLCVAARKTSAYLDERRVPLAGLVAAFVFAAQMLNFPVAAGTSGHLLGGVLAGVLVGPWAGAVCLAVVLVVQALFADGGLTALGLNILNIALVGGVGGYGVFFLLRRLLPATRSGAVAAAGVAGGASVVMAAIAFVLEYAVGGSASVPVTTVVGAMVGVHTLIGIGEGIITAMTVGLVLSVRPDLVYGASDLRPRPTLRAAEGSVA
jgi:cobalt/nickel transport system permease protein